MKAFLKNVRDIAIAGFFALLPLYVMLLILGKAWKSLHSLGSGVAGMFGMPPFMGVGSSTIFTAILVVAVWIGFGLLVRFTVVGALSRAAEGTIAKYVPDYAKYKSMAEEKWNTRLKSLTTPAHWSAGRTTGVRPTLSNRTRMEIACSFSPTHRKPARGMSC